MKGIFLWKSGNVYSGDLGAIISMIRYMGLDRIEIKIGDATSQHSRSFPDMELAVNAIRDAVPGIKVYGWHYVYGGCYYDRITRTPRYNGTSPESEALFAKHEVARLGLDGYIIDAEAEYKIGYAHINRAYHPASRAGRFMRTLQGIDVPVALSSYRYPRYHPQFPFATFLQGCAYHMPQVYWGRQRNAGRNELAESMRQLRAIRDIPFVPVGRAYIGDGHNGYYLNTATEAIVPEIHQFMLAAKEFDCRGVSFWSMDSVYRNGNLWKNAIAGFCWDAVDPGVPTGDVVIIERWKNVRGVLGMVIRDAPGGRDTGERIRFGQEFLVHGVHVPYNGNVWGKISAEYDRWVALGWSARLS